VKLSCKNIEQKGNFSKRGR